MKIHIMGIGGTAMSAVAGLMKDSGHEVRGSDRVHPYPPVGDLLDNLGIPVMHPYDPSNLDWEPDLVVVGNVIRRDNPEAEAMRERQIPFMSFPQALREHYLAGRFPMVVTGTHGKTTTSSLIAWLLHAQGYEPGYLIGGVPLDFGTNFRPAGGKFFVVEGDEYDTAYFDKGPKFLHYAPQAAIINNVEFDHADIYADLEAVISAFRRFARIMPAGAPLLVPAGDKNAAAASAGSDAALRSFGIESGFWHAADVSWSGGKVLFELMAGDVSAGRFVSPLFGRHNLANTVAALGLLHETGCVTPDLARALASFAGVRKRQEIKGVAAGVTVIDDFAHHPTAVRETILAVCNAFPGSRIIGLFEPESNTSRRRVFQNEYVEAFAEADQILFCAPLEKNDNLPPEMKIDMARLVADINARGTPAAIIPDIDELAAAAVEAARPGDVIMGMSGRDFYGVHQKVLDRLRERERVGDGV
ncbi:MAG TPA: UDP-N-acetylmuramate:L-alanyl-gamma-D-glutamyl-meso-diaminopimelate ligase [Myxococcota bacterium]|nr:UDP-N-acetylmuramate:L-alanyl-gamma-D-glutamyl-meso-diaminopimelate ligase [Myxococcota bacterium]HPB51050.1 UDP-N-acetylmuramate:L-alanyl-gamma-D-glutamyl-meso-diaminopimelate ligase [Myxococcota bacterium]HQP95904.1 UDP-N-acetylmuramate:L-alanyl-gamma-D-glutamyl-meso-diaminopimelate ligase [Myxococcota bacterium]